MNHSLSLVLMIVIKMSDVKYIFVNRFKSFTSTKQKQPHRAVLFLAQRTGLEPATSRVHVIHHFHDGMDYIFTLENSLGTPVSSLYGAPTLCFLYVKGSLGVRIFISERSLHRYPGKFDLPFEQKAARLQAGALTKLSYRCIFIILSNIFFFLSKYME